MDLFEYATQAGTEKKDAQVQEAILTVGQITSELKGLIVSRFGRENFWVKGEISNFKGRNHSGHMYFSMKDDRAVLNCVFKNVNRNLKVDLKDGMEVLAFGRVDLWEPGGRYQLIIEEIRPGGLGELYLKFEQLKKKLDAEGLFAPERKRPLPAYAHRIGLVTSPTGAVIRDIIHVVRRRCPFVTLFLMPVKVQGEGAAKEIAAAVAHLNRPELKIDLLIVGRGGGSIEDLWAFNEEAVARAIATSKIPVISAVGHQTDFTIADFVADVRAATPSQAAELAVPDVAETRRRVSLLMKNIAASLARARAVRVERLLGLKRAAPLRDPRVLIRDRSQRLDVCVERMARNLKNMTESRRLRFQKTSSNLELLSPLGVLSRGYSIARTPEGKVVKSDREVHAGDAIHVRLHEGELQCQVKKTSRA